MLRAKAIKYRKGEVGSGERLLASTDTHGQFAGIPIVVQAVNAVNRTKPARKLLDATLGVHPDAWLPDLATRRFRWGLKKSAATQVTNGARRPGKVAIFSTCYVNYNEPGIGHDLVKLLEHNEIPYVLVEKESCCGMPKFELGDLEGVARHKEVEHPGAGALREGGLRDPGRGAVVHVDVQAGTAADVPGRCRCAAGPGGDVRPVRVPDRAHKDGLLKTDFKAALGKVSYHIPCHGRVQKIGRKTEEMFRLIGQTVAVELNTVERCSGHAGTYGVKTPTHPIAMKIGKPVFKAMAQGQARFHQFRLRARRAPHRPGHGGQRAAGGHAEASAEPGAHGIRIGVDP